MHWRVGLKNPFGSLRTQNILWNPSQKWLCCLGRSAMAVVADAKKTEWWTWEQRSIIWLGLWAGEKYGLGLWTKKYFIYYKWGHSQWKDEKRLIFSSSAWDESRGTGYYGSNLDFELDPRTVIKPKLFKSFKKRNPFCAYAPYLNFLKTAFPSSTCAAEFLIHLFKCKFWLLVCNHKNVWHINFYQKCNFIEKQ